MDKAILLVDDEEDIRLVLSMALADMGYDVMTAENGNQGLQMFRENQPPIVVTDIKMPDIDGVELLRRIKNENPDTEVIMITGHGDMDVAIRSFQFEATDFITKPINVDALEAALQRVEEKITARETLKQYTQNLEGLIYQKTEQLTGLEKLLESDQEEIGSVTTRFKRVFDDLPCYVAVMDRQLHLTAMNKKFQDDFGDQVGLTCHLALKQSDEPCIPCPVLDTFSDGKSRQLETSIFSPPDRKCEVLVWTSPIRDQEGVVKQVLVLYVDMTQLLDVQNHLASLGLLLGSISHGIKGMLTGLDGGMYLLDSGLKKENEEQVQEGLNVIKQMVGRIRNMVLDVLLFSKERDLKRETVFVEEFTRDVASTIQTKARERSVAFECECELESGTFEVDAGFLRTALVNVLENALEACCDDKAKPEHSIQFHARGVNGTVEFVVKDNGPGMDEDTCSHIFELFYSAKGRKGTGLGLYITDRTVRQHGGEIKVESEPGRGTNFLITIPRSKPAMEME
jgi:signal transduction histidine kinase/FixJ family two-component response regulator